MEAAPRFTQIKVKMPDGALHMITNSEALPAFYCMPEEVLMNMQPPIRNLPRRPCELLLHQEYREIVESDLFLEHICDGMAYLAWPAMGMNGWMEDYSGYDPFWRVAHCVPIWIDTMEEMQILPMVGDFYRQTMQNPDQHFGFVPEAEIIAIMETVAPYAMEKHGFHEMYQYVRKHRCHEDFGSRRSFDKTNFYVRWYQSDTKHPTKISTDVLRIKNYTRPDFCVNSDGELEESVWDRVEAKAFWDTLSETDQKILWLRWNDMKQEDVAKAVGLSTHSAVSKRIQSIGRRHEKFTNETI